jgi:nucleoid DNA-binding protein
MSDTITKNSLAKTILCETGIPSSIAQELLDNLLEQIINSADKDGAVKIPKFGSFYTKNKKARVGRDINTNKSVIIEARRVVNFYPSNSLKEMVNNDNKPTEQN